MDEEKNEKQRARPSSGVYVYRRKRKDSEGKEQIRWVVEHRPGFGRPKSYRVFEQRTEAEAYGQELRLGLAAPVKVNAESTVTVEEAWHRFRARASLFLRPGSLETYAGSMVKHVLPSVGDLPVGELDSRRVRQLVDGLLMAGVGPSTTRNAISALRSTLAPLVSDGVLAMNPASIQKGWLPKSNYKPKSLTRGQLREFLDAARGEPGEQLIRFLAWTGVRLGEALALRWSEVDLERRTARIVRSVRLAREDEPKTKFGMRTIDLAKTLARDMAVLDSRIADGLVFPAPGGGYISARAVHYRFLAISKRAGLPPVHPHMLRHTWATQMLNAGTPLNYVSRALGHHSTAFTAGVYATAAPDSRHEDVDRLADLTLLNEPKPEA